MLIFPAIDMRNGHCVRLFRGDYDQETVYGDSPAAQAAVWEKEGAPLIHLVDLDGAKAGAPVNVESIRKICETVSIPCELGGGIRSEKDAERVFSLGISRVILGTAACENEELLRSLAGNQFGQSPGSGGPDGRSGSPPDHFHGYSHGRSLHGTKHRTDFGTLPGSPPMPDHCFRRSFLGCGCRQAGSVETGKSGRRDRRKSII